MKWIETTGGLALLVNGSLVGWVTSTLNGRYLHGMKNQTSSMKDVSETKHEAKMKLLSSVGE